MLTKTAANTETENSIDTKLVKTGTQYSSKPSRTCSSSLDNQPVSKCLTKVLPKMEQDNYFLRPYKHSTMSINALTLILRYAEKQEGNGDVRKIRFQVVELKSKGQKHQTKSNAFS